MGRRWLGYGTAALLLLLGLAWGLPRLVRSWRFERSLEEADRAIASGRYGEAREVLAGLADTRETRDDVWMRLGDCERAVGRLDRALAAWARVPARSPYALRAALLRSAILVEQGRWAASEAVLVPLVRDRGAEADEALHRLAWLDHRQGRTGEARALVETLWGQATDRAGMLRQMWLLDDDPTQFEGIRADLEHAGRLAPGDDRVWLGRANLAIRTGQYPEAESWLIACLQRRPEDPAVWRAWLEWARACGRPDEAARAAAHLPAGELAPAEVLALRAWLASRRGDDDAERQALEALIGERPADTVALERLAVLAIARGQTEQAIEYRRRKAEIDRSKDRYRQALHQSPQPGAEANLARMAEQLGRRFEAYGWWSLAVHRDPGRPEFRSALEALTPQAKPKGTAAASGRTLADLLPELPAGPLPREEAPAGPPLVFTDDAEAAGLKFTFENGATPARQLPETMAGGIAVLDYDGDGWLDVYAVQGGPFPPRTGAPGPGDRLFRNRGDGTFEDVTERSGVATLPRAYGHGIAAGDYDNDGHTDLFRTGWRSYALFRNRGDGTFEDVTEVAGLGGDRDWPTSAAFADLDNDGDLDLYVCHYLAWDADHPRVCRDPSASDRPIYCHPRDFAALPDHLWRNDGGRFVDVTAAAGVVDREGRGLGVVAGDLDGDDRVDLFVANDTTANFLFRNCGGLRFEETGLGSGVAANSEGGFQAGMGVACGDLDGDGRPDLAVTNFYGESTTLFRNLGDNLFGDATAPLGLAASSRFLLGFGVSFLDADNDGRLDLATANGHVNDYRPRVPYAMPARLLTGGPGGRLTDVSALAGAPWQVPRVGRGLAVADLDNDGAPDLLLVSQDGPLAFFHNRTRGGHRVTIALEGTASNRDGVGARVTVVAGGRRQVAQRLGGGSYLSACDGRLHFGLGVADRVNSLEVRWPSGRVDRFSGLAADAAYLLREGHPSPRRFAPSAR